MSGQGSGGNVLAALSSFFIPGLGQLLQGRLLMAAMHLCSPVFCGFFCLAGSFTCGPFLMQPSLIRKKHNIKRQLYLRVIHCFYFGLPFLI